MDDGFRKLRGIDQWRAGAGREERNESRRRVRPAANTRLTDLSEEDRAEHERALASNRKWVSRKRADGWTQDQIAAGLAKRHAKRMATITNS